MTDAQAAPRVPVVLSLVLIAFYPLLSLPVTAALHVLAPHGEPLETRFIGEAVAWLYAAIVLGIALFWERRTLASIGWGRPRLSSLGFGIATAVIVMGAGAIASYVIYNVLHQPAHANAQVSARVGTSLIYALCLSLRAGVIEELFYRGLAIEQLSRFIGVRWLSALIAAAVFTLAHALVFDWVQLVPIAVAALILAALYLWRHDLWANIIAHALVDGTGLVALILQAHKAGH